MWTSCKSEGPSQGPKSQVFETQPSAKGASQRHMVPLWEPPHWPHWIGLCHFQLLLIPCLCWPLSFSQSSFKTLTTHLSSAPARMDPTSSLSCHYQICFPHWCLWHVSSIPHFYPVCFPTACPSHSSENTGVFSKFHRSLAAPMRRGCVS